MGHIERNELIFVEHCDVQREQVLYYGAFKPSSESIMHWLIYQDRLDAQAIMHADDHLATQSELLADYVRESEREEP